MVATLSAMIHELSKGRRRKTSVSLAFSFAASTLETVAYVCLYPALAAAMGQAVDPTSTLMTTIVQFVPIAPNAWPVLGVYGFAMFGITSVFLRMIGTTLTVRVGAEVTHSLQEQLCSALYDAENGVTSSLKSGTLNKSIIEDTMRLGFAYEMALRATVCLLSSCLYLSLAAIAAPKAALGVVLLLAVFAGVYVVAARYSKFWSLEASRRRALANDMAIETLANLKYLVASGHIESAKVKLHEGFAKSLIAAQKMAPATSMPAAITELTGTVTILGLVAGTIASGEVFAASTALFCALFIRTVPAVNGAYNQVNNALAQIGWYQSFFDVLAAAKARIRKDDGADVKPFQQTVHVANVTFCYPDAAKPTLQNVDITVKEGEWVAICGHSGSGKTTLLDLISGIARAQQGSVFIDGVDISTMDLRQWRQRLSLVTQETPVFHGTIAENIAWFSSQPDETRIRAAADLAYLTAVLEEMPDGLQTIVGERGARLSGGQRQRLALARALYQQADILILDEPTTGLDADSERMVLDGIRATRGRYRTAVIVSHSRSILALADRVVILNNGAVAESGRPSELFANPASRLHSLFGHVAQKGAA